MPTTMSNSSNVKPRMRSGSRCFARMGRLPDKGLSVQDRSAFGQTRGEMPGANILGSDCSRKIDLSQLLDVEHQIRKGPIQDSIGTLVLAGVVRPFRGPETGQKKAKEKTSQTPKRTL